MTNNHRNFISTYEDALSSDFCDQIINKFESSPQSHVAGKIGAGVNVEKKDSVDCCISEYQEWNEDFQKQWRQIANVSKNRRETNQLYPTAIERRPKKVLRNKWFSK